MQTSLPIVSINSTNCLTPAPPATASTTQTVQSTTTTTTPINSTVTATNSTPIQSNQYFYEPLNQQSASIAFNAQLSEEFNQTVDNSYLNRQMISNQMQGVIQSCPIVSSNNMPIEQSQHPNHLHHQLNNHQALNLKIPECQGCFGLIQDRYFLQVMDRAWHLNCLRCVDCKLSLDTQQSCFAKDGFIYCKDDYFKRFPRKCHGCSQLLNPNELIMRARHLVYHMNCFKCLLCDRQLNTGDEFGIGKDNSIFCRMHYYFHLQQQQPATHQQDKFDYYSIKSESYVNNYDPQQTMCNLPPTPGMSPNNLNPINSVSPTLNQCNNNSNTTNNTTINNSNQNQKGRPKKRKMPNTESSVSNKKSLNKSNKQQSADNKNNSLEANNPNNSKLNNTTITANQTTLSSNQSASNPSETNGSSQTKSKHEIVSSAISSSSSSAATTTITNTTATSHSLIANVESPDEFQSTNVNSKNFDNNLDYFSDNDDDLLDTSSSNGALNLTENTSGVYCANNSNGYYDSVAAVAAAAAAAAAAAQRQKRMRTSFKHHQLRVMKSYFELNHNPDAKDLKQLSQKTGLSKRVLQVWFQNARAKFRRGQSNPNESQDQQSPQTSMNNSQNVSSSSSTSSSTDLNTSIQQHGHHQQLGLDIIDENSSQSLKDQLSINNNSSGLDQSYIMLNGNSASSYHANHQPIHNHLHHQSMIHHNHHANMMNQSQFQYMMQPTSQQQLNSQTADFNSNGLMVDNLLL